jgi:two-component system, NarL family, response regulator DesR
MAALRSGGELRAIGCSLLLVEDDAMVRSWVRLSLRASEFRIAAEVSNAREARTLVDVVEPDFLLVDNRLPDALGTELVRELRRRGVRTPVVMMTANAEIGFSERARDVGAQGSLLKSGSPLELLETLRSVLAGQPSYDTHHPPRKRPALSRGELDVLRHVAKGETNHDIADRTGVSVETVKTLLGRAYKKLGARNRAQAIAIARQLGFL